MPEQDRTSRLIATWFGCGNSPVAPGTVGALGTLPLHFALKALGPYAYFVGAVAAVAAGVWASQRTADALGEKDPQRVVIDEVAGTLIAMGLCQGRSLKAQLLALALFRVLDIVKPGVIDKAQHLKPPGVGIMADDVLAGIVAGVLARLISR
ncbi:MAG TPA: phosphatidylglycerophosphatase A [Polyangiaceae bacterium]